LRAADPIAAPVAGLAGRSLLLDQPVERQIEQAVCCRLLIDEHPCSSSDDGLIMSR